MSRQATLALSFGVSLLAGTLAQGGTIQTLPPGTPVPAPPLPPYGVYVTPDGEDPTRVTVHWSPGSSDHSGFIVERSESSAAFEQVASTGPSATEATNQGLYADRRYKYRVRAFKDIGEGKKLFSASSFSQAYQAPIFKAFSRKAVSHARPKYGFRPLMETDDWSERYLQHILWANYEYASDETLVTTNATYTEYRNYDSSYYRKSLTQKWQGEYVAEGNAHSDYEEKSFSTNSVPYFQSRSDFDVEVQTNADGSKSGQWVTEGTNGTTPVDDPVDMAYPYAAFEPDSSGPVSTRYSVESNDSGSLGEGVGSVTWSWTESGTAGEDLSGKFLNLTFAQEVVSDAPPLEDQPSVMIGAPWHPNYRYLASRAFGATPTAFSFSMGNCITTLETHPCDGSDFDYIVEKEIVGNGEDPPTLEYLLSSISLRGSSSEIPKINITEDLTEGDDDEMIAQNANWRMTVAPKLVAYDSIWPLDEFEKVSPGLVVGTNANSAGAILLRGIETAIDNVTYTFEWDSAQFDVTFNGEVISSPHVETAQTPRNFSFAIHAKGQAGVAARTTFQMRAQAEGFIVGEDKVNVCVLPVEVVEEIETNESAGCTGYDKEAMALMVPIQGTNKIKVRIRAPSQLLSQIRFVASDPSKLTIEPETPTSTDQVLKLSGVGQALGVKVVLEVNAAWIELFEADVMNRLEKTIEIHAITEENDDVQTIAVGTNGGPNTVCVSEGPNGFRDTLPSGDDVVLGNKITTGLDGICDTTANNHALVPSNVPSAAALEAYLNAKTWGNQANVHFTVTRSDHSVNYDLDRNGRLGDPLGYLSVPARPDELQAINGSSARNPAVDYNYYVARRVDVPVAIAQYNPDVVMSQDQSKAPFLTIMAHECGHLLDRVGGHTDGNVSYLMHGAIDDYGGLQIQRDVWRAVNK